MLNKLYHGTDKSITRKIDGFIDRSIDTSISARVPQVVQFEIPPSIAYHRRPDGSLFIFGQEVELVLLLARFFNFTVRYQWPPPGAWDAVLLVMALFYH